MFKSFEIDNLLGRARSYAKGFGDVDLAIVAGAHRHAHAKLDETPISIGSDVNDDMILFADPVEARHVEITRVGTFSPAVKVAAIGGAVNVEGVGQVEPGFETQVKLPARIHFSGVTVEMRSRSPIGDWAKRGYLQSLAIVGAALVLGVIVAYAAPDMTQMAAAAPPAQIVEHAPSVVASGSLQALIDEAGLTGLVTANTGADGVPVLMGRLEGEKAATAYRRLLVELDSLPASRRPNTMVSVDPDAPKPPLIGSIWRGEHPRILFQNGETVAAGGRTASGWTVSRIDEGSITLTSPTGALFAVATR